MKTRLKYITDLIEKDYEQIWDTCCDHGKLGISLLKNSSVKTVHFVDCVPGIIDKLKLKLSKLGLLESSRVKVHLKMAEEIHLENDSSLICICGVGGETAIDIVRGLLKNNNLFGHDILFSVQYRTPELRMFLKDYGFRVQKEILCFEGKWAHEIIRVSINNGDEIDLIGSGMFNLDDEKHLSYIKKTIKHYTKKNNTGSEYQKVLELYKKL